MRIRRLAAMAGAAALALGILSACGSSAPASSAQNTTGTIATPRTMTPGDHVVNIPVGGRIRSFIIHIPPNPPRANRPLLLVFHGANGSDLSTVRGTDFERVANQYGQIVAFLQGYQDTWNEGAGHTPAERAHVNDVAFTSAVIAKIEHLVAFDHKRIVATGFSNGALMVEYLGCRIPQQLALIVPVEGQLPRSVSANCSPSRPISVFEIHATADSVIPYGGGPFHGVGGGTTVLSAPSSVARWAALEHCSRSPRVTFPSGGIKLATYSGCHGGATIVLRTIEGGSHQWGGNIAALVTEALNG